MKHLTASELREVLVKIRNKEMVNKEDLEALKRYIPMHLSKEVGDKMSKLMEDIRTGKRPPMSDEERLVLHNENLEHSLVNVVKSIPEMNDEQFEEVCNMCETLRSSQAY